MDIDIAALRYRLGLSQGELAYLLLAGPRTLQGWESGRSAPTQVHVALLAAASALDARQARAALDAGAPLQRLRALVAPAP
jgi:DNA-binding transcriptional regulator YiaG